MHCLKAFSLVLAFATTAFAKIHLQVSSGGHGANTDGLNHCLDMYQKAAEGAHQGPGRFKSGDWKPLRGIDSYDAGINHQKFDCKEAENITFEDGKRRSNKARTPYLQACMPFLRRSALRGARWAHCSIHDRDFMAGSPSGKVWMGWSPKGFQICGDAKGGKRSTGPCRMETEQKDD